MKLIKDPEVIRKKLFFHKAQTFLILDAPDEFLPVLAGIEYDDTICAEKRGTYDYIQVFATKKKDLVHLLEDVVGMGKRDCLFWASYPKLTSPLAGNLNREAVWHLLRLEGLNAVAQVAIDDTWTALRGRPQK